MKSELETLRDRYSDTHKDVRGYRPTFGSRRGLTPEQWNDAEWLKREIARLNEEAEIDYQNSLRR